MRTECNQVTSEFHGLLQRKVKARFDGGKITSDAGVLLLREVEKRTGLIDGLAQCFTDHRDARLIEHTVKELLGQRVYGLCLGYEDLNDHDQLRTDPMLAVAVEKVDPLGESRRQAGDRGKALAGKCTLNRLELSGAEADGQERYKKIVMDEDRIEGWMVDAFLAAHDTAPEEIVLDMDATDDPIHGQQEGRFFHGYYRRYCYLPLYIFCGEHLLCARLRRSNIDGADGAVDELKRIIGQIRHSWPGEAIHFGNDNPPQRRFAPTGGCFARNRGGFHFGITGGFRRNTHLTAQREMINCSGQRDRQERATLAGVGAHQKTRPFEQALADKSLFPGVREISILEPGTRPLIL